MKSISLVWESRWFASILAGAAIFLSGHDAFASSGTIGSLAAEQVGKAQASKATRTPGPAHISVMRTPAGGSFIIGMEPGSGHVTVSKAANIVGQPVDIFHPIGPAKSISGMPLSAAALTSGFGMRHHPILKGYSVHRGIDLAAPIGTPIVATADGTVSKAEWNGSYGLVVALDHGKGRQTRYGHMSRLNVSVGQRVRKGNVIGYVGSTGRSTGPHLHYELRINGQAVNPLSPATK